MMIEDKAMEHVAQFILNNKLTLVDFINLLQVDSQTQ